MEGTIITDHEGREVESEFASRKDRLNEQVSTSLQVAQKFEITSNEQYEVAGQYAKEIKGLITQVDETFEPMRVKAYAAYQEVLTQKNAHLAPLQKALLILKDKMGTFFQAEQARKDAELRAAREKAEADARAAQEAEALKLRSEKKFKQAKAVEAAPLSVDMAMMPTPEEAPKVKGVAAKQGWDFEITNELAIPRKYLVPDLKKIRAAVTSLGDQHGIAGVTAKRTTNISVSGK